MRFVGYYAHDSLVAIFWTPYLTVAYKKQLDLSEIQAR